MFALVLTVISVRGLAHLRDRERLEPAPVLAGAGRRERGARSSVRGTQGLVSGMRRALAWFVLGVLPVATFGAILVMSFRSGVGAWALDFNGNFTIPAHDILRGVSPVRPGVSRARARRRGRRARSPTSSPRACS